MPGMIYVNLGNYWNHFRVNETVKDIAIKLNIPVEEVNPREYHVAVVHGEELKDLGTEHLDDTQKLYLLELLDNKNLSSLRDVKEWVLLLL